MRAGTLRQGPRRGQSKGKLSWLLLGDKEQGPSRPPEDAQNPRHEGLRAEAFLPGLPPPKDAPGHTSFLEFQRCTLPPTK